MTGPALMLRCGAAAEEVERRCVGSSRTTSEEGFGAYGANGWAAVKQKGSGGGGRWHEDAEAPQRVAGMRSTHPQQQRVFADPLDGSHEVTLQRNLCVFPASQQHAVLQDGKRKGQNKENGTIKTQKSVCCQKYSTSKTATSPMKPSRDGELGAKE